MRLELTAVFVEAEEGGYWAFVKELPGALTQGESLDETRAMLDEAVRLILQTNRDLAEQSVVGQRVICEPIVVDEPAWR